MPPTPAAFPPSPGGDGFGCPVIVPNQLLLVFMLTSMAALAGFAFTGCGGASRGATIAMLRQGNHDLGLVHRVGAKEDLHEIAQHYARSPQLLAWMNEIDQPWRLKQGGYLYVPPDNSTRIISSGKMTLLNIRRLRERLEAEEVAQKSPSAAHKVYSRKPTGDSKKKQNPASSSTSASADSETVLHKKATVMKTYAAASGKKGKPARPSIQPAVPNSSSGPRTADASPKRPASRASARSGGGGPQAVSAAGFSWPLQGTWVRGFNEAWPRAHAGVDISAPEGTEVYAAADGLVFLSDSLGSYGKLIVIEHPNGMASVYAHNSENLVIEGDEVRRGDMIARVGSTGNATGPHCHFELRRDGEAIDPMGYMPPFEEQRAVAEKTESQTGLIGWLR